MQAQSLRWWWQLRFLEPRVAWVLELSLQAKEPKLRRLHPQALGLTPWGLRLKQQSPRFRRNLQMLQGRRALLRCSRLQEPALTLRYWQKALMSALTLKGQLIQVQPLR